MALNEEFIKIRPFNPNPPGGQQVGCPSPAIEATHDLGITIVCALGRSQVKNRNIALAAMEYAIIEAGITEPAIFKPNG